MVCFLTEEICIKKKFLIRKNYKTKSYNSHKEQNYNIGLITGSVKGPAEKFFPIKVCKSTFAECPLYTL